MKALKRAPERFVEVSWDGENEASYRVELQIDAYDRTRLLEDLSRTFSEAGINILEASCTTNHPMVKNRSWSRSATPSSSSSASPACATSSRFSMLIALPRQPDQAMTVSACGATRISTRSRSPM